MSDTERVHTDDAPSNDNPYSQGVRAGGTLYVSGYGPIDPETGEEVDGSIEARTDRVLDSLAAVVSAAGGDGLDDVVKVTVYVTDLDDYDRVNKAYGARFPGEPPARVYVEVARLPATCASNSTPSPISADSSDSRRRDRCYTGNGPGPDHRPSVLSTGSKT